MPTAKAANVSEQGHRRTSKFPCVTASFRVPPFPCAFFGRTFLARGAATPYQTCTSVSLVDLLLCLGIWRCVGPCSACCLSLETQFMNDRLKALITSRVTHNQLSSSYDRYAVLALWLGFFCLPLLPRSQVFHRCPTVRCLRV